MELLGWRSVCSNGDLVLKRILLVVFMFVLDNKANLVYYFPVEKTLTLQLRSYPDRRC